MTKQPMRCCASFATREIRLEFVQRIFLGDTAPKNMLRFSYANLDQKNQKSRWAGRSKSTQETSSLEKKPM
ncbi:hypothetical protein PLA107_033975 (plasmid) [Pseudomonas amygdali pv. lachrymans str. M301315]|uniref:Uncharacterized protein n=1 Tax=Pseudomonas amygdali pv. lachrymans str. M301315 TaxID=629260 RepID=A0AAD0PWV5_PSEAV|nr:hypothetical protein PLA107_033975 [Pseudomonas amygdali pv. lachrymans str. M301315]